MDFEERLENARKILGKDAKVIRKRKPGTKRKTKPLSSFVPRKTKGRRNMSHTEYQQCGKKTRYKSETDARKYAARLSDLRGYPIRTYYCRFCRGWHLTHRPDKAALYGGKYAGYDRKTSEDRI